MKKTIAAITLAFYLTGATLGTTFAAEVNASEASQISTATQSESTSTSNDTLLKDSAGVLPTSVFYGLERGIEELQLAITKSQEKLAALKAQFASERAAEAVVMANEGKEELANKATVEYMKLLNLAVKDINNAIESKDEAVKTLETLNKSYASSQELLHSLLANAAKPTKDIIQTVLNDQDKAVTAINDFYTAKKAFFEAKSQLKQAQIELQAARKTGDAQAIKLAEEKVKTAEAVKDELEAIKDAAESAKEEVQNLEEETEKIIKSGLKQVEKANDKMEIVEEKSIEATEKAEEKAAKESDKEVKKAQKAEEKQLKKDLKESAKHARKEAQQESKKAREDAKKIAEKAREDAKEAAEHAREQSKQANHAEADDDDQGED